MSRRDPSRVVIIGAGGFGRETASLLADLAEVGSHTPVGFLDDAPELSGATVAGLPVMGGIDDAGELEGVTFVVSVGNPHDFSAKERIVAKLGIQRDRYATLIHPEASIGRQVEIEEGTVVLAGTVVTQGAKIGRHVGIMPNVVITHDDEIQDFVIIGAGATVAGEVTLETGAYIGAGATIGGGVTIGRAALVGMGAVVTHDVPPGEIWAGVPARKLR